MKPATHWFSNAVTQELKNEENELTGIPVSPMTDTYITIIKLCFNEWVNAYGLDR